MNALMKKTLLFFCSVLLIPAIGGSPGFASPVTDGTYSLSDDYVGSGGETTTNMDYRLSASIGLPAQGNSFSTTMIIQAGFWFAANPVQNHKKSNLLLMLLPAILSNANR